MWIIATHNRPEHIARYIDHARKHGTLKHVHVLINRGDCDDQYREVMKDAPTGWSHSFDGPRKQIPALNAFIATLKGFDWVGHLCDDLQLPDNSMWERCLLDAAMKHGVAYTKDSTQPRRLHGAGIFRMDIIKALGWMFPPTLQHMYGDDVWETFARELKVPHIVQDIETVHLHPINGFKGDATHVGAAQSMEADRLAFNEWHGQRFRDYHKIAKLVGAEIKGFDLSKFKIAVCTPSKDGNVSMEYMYSLLQMDNFCRTNKIQWQHFNISGNSLLCDARNDLVKLFWEGDFTHMLMVDADMGWPADALARLLSAEKDIIGAAGPQRKAALRFCFALKEDGSFDYDTRTGNMVVGRIGTGFLLISREFVQKMIDAYPGEVLMREYKTEEPFFNLFHQARVDRGNGYHERLSEDYTLCEDWRAIGGQVWMDPTIVLEHKGSFIQKGAAIDVLRPLIDSITPQAAE